MNPAVARSANAWARRPILSPLSILILVGLGTRIFLLNWYRGEYTDGIIQLQLFENANTYFPPLYPLLVHWVQALVRDAILAGRLVSLIASTLVLIPVYHLTKRLADSRAALWAGVLYLGCAVVNRWALRVMSDSLFTLFFTLGVMAFVFSLSAPWQRSGQPAKMAEELELALARLRIRRWTYALIAAAGLATLTRYQGLALLPLVGWSWWRNRKGYTRWEVLETLLALLPWVALFYWLGARGFGHPEQFVGRIHRTLGETLLAYWDMGETFILYLPYALTVPVFALVLIGYFALDHSPSLSHTRWTLLYLLALWLPVHSAFQSFQYRYFLPLVPLLLAFAGRGVMVFQDAFRRNRRRGALPLSVLAAAFSVLFSAAVLYFQRDAFADFTDIGRLIAGNNLKGGRIFAAEVYNEGNYNIKLSFWAERPIPYCGPLEQFPFEPGDYVVLSNVYNPAGHVSLSQRYRFEVFYETPRYRLIPLLPDIMTNPPGTTSQPLCMAYRYFPQVYYSYVVRITGRRDTG